MGIENLHSLKALFRQKIKFIKSLRLKKYRYQKKAFLLEGAKNIKQLLESAYEVQLVVGTPAFIAAHDRLLAQRAIETLQVDQAVLASLGSFQCNNAALAVATCKPNQPVTLAHNAWGLVLDDIRDPGNLGTIIRIADWYGITAIICSSNTVDLYNPKVLHASMGSFLRVNVYYTALPEYLSKTKRPVLGACIGGRDVHHALWPLSGLIVIGNEVKGISSTLLPYIQHHIGIPCYGHAESLNAAMATAVICDNWRRKHP